MEILGIAIYGNSIQQLRDSPTLLAIGEMLNEHTTKLATRTKNVSIQVRGS